MKPTLTRKEITDAYMALCMRIDRITHLSTYTLLYDGRYEELMEQLDAAKERLEIDITLIDSMGKFIERLKP